MREGRQAKGLFNGRREQRGPSGFPRSCFDSQRCPCKSDSYPPATLPVKCVLFQLLLICMLIKCYLMAGSRQDTRALLDRKLNS